MIRTGRWIVSIAALAIATFGFAAAPAGAALPNYTCSGGTPVSPAVVPAGVYQSLTIAEDASCITAPAPGVIEVHGLLKVMPGAAFDAGEPGTAKLWVQNNLTAGTNAWVSLGCAGAEFGTPINPAASDCTAHSFNGAILANGAIGVIIHGIQVRGDVTIQGGGGGVNCDFFFDDELLPNYTTVEDSLINGAVKLDGLQTCWFGLFRNQVRGNIIDTNNSAFDPDANEVADNVSNNQIMCSGNSPAAQVGDSAGGPNKARGGGKGECAPPITTT